MRLGPPHCPGPSCPPAFAPRDDRGKQPNLISSPTGSFYSSFHGNSYFNVSKEGGARFFKKMIVEKLSWASVSCNGGFHGNSSQRQTKMRRRWVSPNHGYCSGGAGGLHHSPTPKRDAHHSLTRGQGHPPRSLMGPRSPKAHRGWTCSKGGREAGWGGCCPC